MKALFYRMFGLGIEVCMWEAFLFQHFKKKITNTKKKVM
jgi:hypothetical protein